MVQFGWKYLLKTYPNFSRKQIMKFMPKHRQFSLRYKILLVLTAIPLIVLVLYLALAVTVFKNDKIAYVFESSTSVAKTLSSQSVTELNSILNLSKPIMQEFLLRRNFGDVAQGVLAVEGPILWISAFKEDGTSVQRVDLTERNAGQAKADLQSFGELSGLIKEAKERGRVFRVPFKDDRVLIVERVGDVKNPETRYFFILAKLEELANAFRRPGTTENYLVNPNGYVYFGPAGSEATYLTTRLSSDFFEKAKASQFSSGAMGVKSPEGVDLLASYSKAPFGDTTVVSLARQDDALKAVSTLIQRSVYFLIVLLSGTVIVSLFTSNSLTSPLVDLFQATKKIAEGHFDIQVKVKSNDEIGSLATSFNSMAEEVQRLMLETADKARMQSELRTAKTVQETLFPPAEAQFGDFYIAGYYEPASECGGDWWHYCEIGSRVFLWIGDATGHGAPAALITSAAKSASTIIERLNLSTAESLDLLNRAIYDVSKGGIMMTFFLGCYDRSTRKFTYSNASHEAPFLIKNSGQPPKKKDLIPLNDVNSPRLGQARDTKYEQTEITIDPGDRILFYTDGIPDIENLEKKSWGERDFIKAIIEVNSDYPSAKVSVDRLVEKFSSYRQNTALKDDITFFMCQLEQGEAV
jgi:sigma-B regulation protein RsbU (phosphoserine phosphatase)